MLYKIFHYTRWRHDMETLLSSVRLLAEASVIDARQSSNQRHYIRNNDDSDSYQTWWRHQMETFSALLVICGGNSLVTGEFPSQSPVTQSFDVFFDLCLSWVKNRKAGDLIRHHAHYDVSVMKCSHAPGSLCKYNKTVCKLVRRYNCIWQLA